jgi:hypothetical protein
LIDEIQLTQSKWVSVLEKSVLQLRMQTFETRSIIKQVSVTDSLV